MCMRIKIKNRRKGEELGGAPGALGKVLGARGWGDGFVGHTV